MAKLLEYTDKREGTPDVMFFCPGCKCGHSVYVAGRKNVMNGCTWDFNNNFEKPTFTPSILINWQNEKENFVCHSYVKDGMIQFLDDCTHELKGQTVELPDMN